MALSHLVWREPLWLGLALLPWIGWTLGAMLRRRGRQGYADRRLLPWAAVPTAVRITPERLWRHAALAAAWLLFAAAMAGPRVPEKIYAQGAAKGPQLMVVLDLSLAMTARDVEPSRLELARLDLQAMIARAQGLRIGLVVYAGTPHLMVPPTADKAVLLHDLGLLRYGLLPTAGSNLQGALSFAAGQFASARTPRALLVVTNGGLAADDAAAQAALDATAARLSRQGIRIYALGVGTRQGAALQTRNGDWLRYEGKAVISRLHVERLRKLAALGQGGYATASLAGASARALYAQGIARQLFAAPRGAGNGGLVVWRELYGWCLVPGLLLLFLVYFKPGRRPLATALLPLIAAVALAITLAPPAAHASPPSWQRRAYQAYLEKSYREAQQDYARVAGYVGRMGEGSSAYRLGDYRQAAGLFTQAVLDADSDAQRADAVFNLANCRYRLGDYRAAASLYRQALLYAPQNQGARTNLSFALLELKQRKVRQTGKARQGSGPRTGGAPAGTDIRHGVGLAQRTPSKPSVLRAAPNASPPPDSGQNALQLEFSATAGPGSAEPAQRYASTSAQRIAMEAGALKVDPGVLWQRIFARQAGFPAPPATPRDIKGVLPW